MNTQTNENWLDFIKSFHIQLCSLQALYALLALAEVVFKFQSNQNGLNDPKGNKT